MIRLRKFALVSLLSLLTPSLVLAQSTSLKRKAGSPWRLTLGLGATQQFEQTDSSEQMLVGNSLALFSFGRTRWDVDLMYSQLQSSSSVGFLKVDSRTVNFELMGRYTLTTFKFDSFKRLRVAPYLGAILLFQHTEVQTKTPYESETAGTGGFKPDFGTAIGVATLRSTFHLRTEAYALHRQETVPEWTFGGRAILGFQFEL